MKKPLITIIVPIYNMQAYLDRCITSIIQQTYSNLDILLIDDGSKDNSLKICWQYQKLDKRIRIIHQDNKGLSSAKNTGLSNHKGKYIAFIDADDYIDNQYIELLYNDLIATNSDISLCNYYNTINKVDYPKIDKKFILEGRDKYKFLLGKYSIQTVISCNKLYKEEIFQTIRFQPNIKHEDANLIGEILKRANRVSYRLDLCLYHYTQRDNSLSASCDITSLDNIVAFEKNMKIMQNNQIQADYRKFELSIYLELKYILTTISIKSGEELIIQKYQQKLLNYQRKILHDQKQKLLFKVIVLINIVFPNLFCKINQIRKQQRRYQK